MQDLLPPPPIVSLRSILSPGLAAVRKYWRPFLLLQSAALLLVLAYYNSRHVRAICEVLSAWKDHGGLPFAAVAAALSGGLLPELAKALVMGDWRINRRRMHDVGFTLVVFAGCGMIVDVQYRAFAFLLGRDQQLGTILRKVLVDQFVTTPIYGTPYYLVMYGLRANGYNLFTTVRQISPRWYVTAVLPLLIPAWCFWLPMVALIYSLPGALQFCLYCFALAAWSLLMVFVATYETRAH
jgi:hypothetical protein